jgi:hypothetical protein
MQSVPIIINVVNSNTAHGEMYSIQHYVIRFVSDLRHCSNGLSVSMLKGTTHPKGLARCQIHINPL